MLLLYLTHKTTKNLAIKAPLSEWVTRKVPIPGRCFATYFLYLNTLRMNTLKLKVVVLCFLFITVGYIAGSYITKNKYQEKVESPVENKVVEYPENDAMTVYQIKYGDTLDSIAKLFGVTKEAIMKENGLTMDIPTNGGWLRIPRP